VRAAGIQVPETTDVEGGGEGHEEFELLRHLRIARQADERLCVALRVAHEHHLFVSGGPAHRRKGSAGELNKNNKTIK
jgi:hypothetical protein